MNMTARFSAMLLVAALLLGGYLRVGALIDEHPEQITLAGDAREYQWYVDHILSPKPVAPPDRMPGLPLLLLPAFYALPGTHDAIQAWVTTVLSTVLIAAIYWLAVAHVGRAYGLLVAIALALNPVLIHNGPRGLTEELFLLCMTAALIVYGRIADGSNRSVVTYGLLGISAGAVALTRYDSALALVPLAVAAVIAIWKSVGWQGRLVRIVPLTLLPVLLVAVSRMYAQAQGFQNIVWRTGNRFFWQEFLRGRMPYEYMFYAEITMKDWLLDYHSLWDLTHMVLMGTIHTVVSMGEIMGGQSVLVAAMAGAGICIARREWAFPCSVVLILLPQYAFGRFHGEGDMFRYLLRALPFVLLLSVIALRELVNWLAVHDGWPAALRGRLQTATVLTGIALLISWAPGSAYAWVMPQVSQAWQVAQLPSTEERLVELWSGFNRGEVSLDELAIEAEALRQLNPDWAPTHLVLGIAEHQKGNLEAGTSHLEEAVRLVPWFIEAGATLAELHFLTQEWDRFHHVVDSMEQSRPGHPTAKLLTGHGALIKGEAARAQAAYEEYIGINHRQSRMALERQRRFRVRRGITEFVHEIDAFLLRDVDTDPMAGLQTPVLWTFHMQDLGLDLPLMDDEDTYYNLGLAMAMQGLHVGAEKRWKQALEVAPRHGPAWANLGILLARQGRLQEALEWFEDPPQDVDLSASIRQWLEGLVMVQLGDQHSAKALFTRANTADPTDGWERASLQHLKQSDIRVLAFLPPRIVLPMTAKRVYIRP